MAWFNAFYVDGRIEEENKLLEESERARKMVSSTNIMFNNWKLNKITPRGSFRYSYQFYRRTKTYLSVKDNIFSSK
jgi:hypothetical protein